MMTLESGCRVQGVDLSGGDFINADLAGSTFLECVFRDVQFSGSGFEDTCFIGCRFIRCRFANGLLREAAFEKCVFTDDQGHVGVQFAFSNLEQARFLDCDLSFAKIDRSDLHGILLESCNLRGAVFHKVDFSRSFGRKLVKWSCVMKSCNMALADLTEARLPGCDLSGSIFREAVLIDADLEGADLRRCDVTQALTAGTKFARADLRGAEMAGLNLKDLATCEGMMVSADQQHGLLLAMGLDVCP